MSFTEHVNSENFDLDPVTYDVDHYEKDHKQEELDNMWQQLEGAMIQSNVMLIQACTGNPLESFAIFVPLLIHCLRPHPLPHILIIYL
jgi:hypothetical protein